MICALDLAFAAMVHPTRREIVNRLAQGGAMTGAIVNLTCGSLVD